MQCYVFHGAKGVDYNVTADSGRTFRLRGGQIIWRKSDRFPLYFGQSGTIWGATFSARDLHNDISGDNYPDFTLAESPQGYGRYECRDKTVYPLSDFNASVYGMSKDGGSYNTIMETVQIYSGTGSNAESPMMTLYSGDYIIIGAGKGYSGTDAGGGSHGLISASGWYHRDWGTWDYVDCYMDFDPSQWPSQHGINTW